MKFNLKVSETDLDTVTTNKESTGPKMLQPGVHQVRITEVVEDGPPVADDTWIKFKITYEDKEGKSLRKQLLLVPTESLDYGTDRKQGPKRNLLSFLNALGEDVSVKTLPQTVSKWFEKSQRLVNQRLEVKVGYSNNHAKYLGKDSFQLVDAKDQPVLDSNGNPVIASDRQSIEMYAKQAGMRFDIFPSVISYGEPVTKHKAAKKVVSSDEDGLF